MTQVYTGTIIGLGFSIETPGYGEQMCVRLQDSHRAMVPKAEFERSFIPLGNIDHLPLHQQRVIAEHAVNKDRLTKLDAFIFNNELFQKLSSVEQCDMSRQSHLMEELDEVLARRIERFTKVASSEAAE